MASSDKRILHSINFHGNVHSAVSQINERGIAPEDVHSIIPVTGNYTVVVVIMHAPKENTDGR